MNESEKKNGEKAIQDTGENIRNKLSLKDNRPRWVIYFDVFVWIITIALMGYFIFEYKLDFTVVNVYAGNSVTGHAPEGRIGGGKIMNLNLTAFEEENPQIEIINVTDRHGELREWGGAR